MAGSIDQYVQQLPLLILVCLPLISAICGLRSVNLKSVLHFQQGTLGTSPWRAATTMVFLYMPVFFIWSFCMRTPSAMLFQAGASLALVLTTITSSPILHYLPSPCISKYYQWRFLSQNFRSLMSMVQCLLLTICTIILLTTSSLFLSSITGLSIYLVLPLIAYFSLFSIIFSGHSAMMNLSFFFYIAAVFTGFGLFLFYGLKEVESIDTLVPSDKFKISESLCSLLVGFIVHFYLLNSSFLYSIFSPMPTMHKLRLTLILYGVFQFLISFMVFVFSTVFINFLDEHCKFPMTFGSFFQFLKVTFSNKLQVFTVCASCICVLSFCIKWCLMSLITIIWEEYLTKKLKNWNPIQQLCSLQFALLILTTILVVVTVMLNLAKIPISTDLPTILYIIFTLFAICAAVTVCGYYLPFCSSTGAISSFLLTISATALYLTVYLLNNPADKFQNICILEDAVGNATETRSISMERVVYYVSHVPPQYLPIISFILLIFCCAGISFLTGGQDQMSLDWNLIAFTWATSIRSPSAFSKRPFVDSESFRYAQQQNANPTPSPDIYR